MIKRVHLEFFKKFKKESFDLTNTMILAGANNAGKTTLLQAIATWHFAYKVWEKKKIVSSSNKRRGVPITRKEFLSIPIQQFKLLWFNTSTTLSKEEGGGKGAATPRVIKITLEGEHDNKAWKHTMEFRYANSEQIYVQPSDDSTLPNGGLDVVYIPPFSGIEVEEKVHTREYQEWLIGQGKPGDIIRNLLVEVASKPQGKDWNELVADIKEIFACQLLEPQHAGLPFIQCEYLPYVSSRKAHAKHTKLDIANAGSGFLQVLLLLAFWYARPSTVVVIDEPDAHLHIILQKQIYTWLKRKVAERQHIDAEQAATDETPPPHGCQMIIATHSEVVIDNTDPDNIISFYGEHTQRLAHDVQKDSLQVALKRLTTMDALMATQQKKVLYVEGETDIDILRALAASLNHCMQPCLDNIFCWKMRGNSPQEARKHFFALKMVEPEITGILLLDNDNKKLPAHEVNADGLHVFSWERYEIENYLIHPAAIARFVCDKFGLFGYTVNDNMQRQLPPVVIESPFGNDAYLTDTPASKGILPAIFTDTLQKRDYYQLAEAMQADEIHPEVKEKLDKFAAIWGVESK